MRAGQVVTALLSVAALAVALVGCDAVHGPGPPGPEDELLSLDQLVQMGFGLADGETVDVPMSAMSSEARAELLERNPALAGPRFMDQVIRVTGGSGEESPAARGRSLCSRSRYSIAHNPWCTGYARKDKYRENFYDNCIHDGYAVANPGSVVELTCSKRSCPYLSSTWYIYHDEE